MVNGFSPKIETLIESLQCLPGVGPRSARRMALYLLERHRQQAQQLAEALSDAVEHVGHCSRCQTFSETDLCPICANTRRDPQQLCIVENPADVFAIEQTGGYRGFYYVLMGHLSPLDGIGPEELGMEKLAQRFDEENIQELILATNPTVEGEATAHYIADMAQTRNIKCSRIAHGVPVGGELEYIDENTLARAFSARLPMLEIA